MQPDHALRQPLSIAELATKIVMNYLERANISPDALPGFIRDIRQALGEEHNGEAHAAHKRIEVQPDRAEERLAGVRLGQSPQAPPAPKPREPAIAVENSITKEHIYCLECGKACKALKTHLSQKHELDGIEYRRRWHLPLDYPLVAPSYSDRRKELGKIIGNNRSKKLRDARAGAR